MQSMIPAFVLMAGSLVHCRRDRRGRGWCKHGEDVLDLGPFFTPPLQCTCEDANCSELRKWNGVLINRRRSGLAATVLSAALVIDVPHTIVGTEISCVLVSIILVCDKKCEGDESRQ
jgi:hypothetical protein